jgi:hypothetical protein
MLLKTLIDKKLRETLLWILLTVFFLFFYVETGFAKLLIALSISI